MLPALLCLYVRRPGVSRTFRIGKCGSVCGVDIGLIGLAVFGSRIKINDRIGSRDFTNRMISHFLFRNAVAVILSLENLAGILGFARPVSTDCAVLVSVRRRIKMFRRNNRTDQIPVNLSLYVFFS